jgi:hypothetical protein
LQMTLKTDEEVQAAAAKAQTNSNSWFVRVHILELSNCIHHHTINSEHIRVSIVLHHTFICKYVRHSQWVLFVCLVWKWTCQTFTYQWEMWVWLTRIRPHIRCAASDTKFISDANNLLSRMLPQRINSACSTGRSYIISFSHHLHFKSKAELYTTKEMLS